MTVQNILDQGIREIGKYLTPNDLSSPPNHWLNQNALALTYLLVFATYGGLFGLHVVYPYIKDCLENRRAKRNYEQK